MLDFLNKKNNPIFSSSELTILLAKIAQIYKTDEIEPARADYLAKTIEKFGCLPYCQFKVLEELTDGEAIFCLIEKLKYAKTFLNKEFVKFKNPSVLSRLKIKDSNWLKKEGHNIKLLALSALGNGAKKDEAGHFIDWIKCLITLDSGNLQFNILPTTLYLIPFFEREFDCAYLVKADEVSSKLADSNLYNFLGLDADLTVRLFIELAQLCNHPVIYDVLPQTARFSKTVLQNPFIARWIDVKELSASIIDYLDALCGKIMQQRIYPEEAILKTKKLYIDNLKGVSRKYSAVEKNIVEEIEKGIKEFKISASNLMSRNKKQEEILKKVQKVLDKFDSQSEKTAALIKEGLWTLPGGAWCSAGVAVFDKMSAGKKYPVFKHYDYKNNDVTKCANLDCQTPFYFYMFENNKYNKKVIDFYIQYLADIQEKFNFDGFRVDHIDHIVDKFSKDENNHPISYRTPAKVLAKINSTLKKKIPYFATLAEYMLWDGYYREYHKEMGFDVLWGDDIVCQSLKTPEQIIKDNLKLENYNLKNSKNNPLSILKTYNNQDGEFRDINRYPAQLGAQGALFKWFKLKFIKGGKFAQRPTLFVDGDESFTKVGIERVISKETSMIRNTDWSFWEKFNAINYFSQNDPVLINSKSVLISEDKNGFACWELKPENKKQGGYLVVANCLNPTEIKEVYNSNGCLELKNTKGVSIKNSRVELNSRKLVSYFDFSFDENNRCFLKEHPLKKEITGEIIFKELRPAEFKLYKIL